MISPEDATQQSQAVRSSSRKLRCCPSRATWLSAVVFISCFFTLQVMLLPLMLPDAPSGPPSSSRATHNRVYRGVGKDRQAEDLDDFVARVNEVTGTFRCGGEGLDAVYIPISRVNDDYCDCPGGKDEPGTSACAGQVGSEWGFVCLDGGRGLRGSKHATVQVIPLSRVDDGICDCCDGSDESTAVVCSRRGWNGPCTGT